MPLTGTVSFSAMLQKSNRIAVPKLIRWQFKMEADQVLKVGITLTDVLGSWQVFYAKMSKDGRILIPLLTLALVSREEKPALEGHVFDVSLEPA